jgi:hypothetical protein
MSSLTINIDIVSGEYLLTASITSTGDIPTDIFLYENAGSGLGQYQSICTLEDFSRVQTYVGTDIPVFGNKFIKYTQAVIHIPLDRDPRSIKAKLIKDVQNFKAAYLSAKSSTQTILL